MIEIIPAIDLIDGKAVRLTKGDYNQKEYDANPLDVALRFQDAGINRLHLVDLDGAKAKQIINWKVLETIANNTSLNIDFGGGVQSDHDIDIAFSSGAKQITGGSIAVRNEDLFLSWVQKYGPEKIILGADANNNKIAVSGWQESTDEHVVDFVRKFNEMGLKYTISTDVAKDGMLQGPSFSLYSDLKKEVPQINIIASGGISEMADIERLNDMEIYGVIIGKAIYENRISLKELEAFTLNAK